MSENVRKLVGVAAMAALVVVGLVTTSGGDDDVDFTRNFGGCRYESPYCRAELARLAPAFLKQAAPKANHLNRDPIFRYVPDGRNDGKVSIEAQKDAAWNFKDGKSGSDIKALSAGKASVLKGRGVDGKGGTSSFRAGTAVNGKTGKAGLVGGTMCSARKSLACSSGVAGVADRIEKLGFQRTRGLSDSGLSACNGKVVDSLKNVLVSSYSGEDTRVASYDCQDLSGNGGAYDFPYPGLPLLLAECMESKVGGVLLRSHIEAMADECVATVMPALLPERAKRLGTYWQTPEQLTALLPALASETNEE